MKTINQLDFDITGNEQFHMIQKDAVMVHCQMQRGRLCLWVECDPYAEAEEVTFKVVATGQPFEKNWVHVGTAVSDGGYLVWHLLKKDE